MSRIILSPTPERIKIWGILAHVDDSERNRILNVDFGNFQREIKLLERELAYARKKKK